MGLAPVERGTSGTVGWATPALGPGGAGPWAVRLQHHRIERVPGLTIPGIANCHSHAFHRALRGRTQQGSGTFWTWREQMYAAAERLTPDLYFELARATYREMRVRRDHRGGRVPLPAPRARRHAVRRRERDGPGTGGGGAGGGDPDRAARHLLPRGRDRARAGGRPAPVQRRRRRAVGGAGGRPQGRRRDGDRRGRALGAGGPARPGAEPSSPPPRAVRCTPTSASRSRRTRPASRRTA